MVGRNTSSYFTHETMFCLERCFYGFNTYRPHLGCNVSLTIMFIPVTPPPLPSFHGPTASTSKHFYPLFPPTKPKSQPTSKKNFETRRKDWSLAEKRASCCRCYDFLLSQFALILNLLLPDTSFSQRLICRPIVRANRRRLSIPLPPTTRRNPHNQD